MHVQFIILGWVVVALAMFALLRPRLAVLLVTLGGWMLLPMAAVTLGGLPDINKHTVIAVGLILGILVFDPQVLRTYRFEWFDIPILIYGLAGPFITSLTNDLGPYDGASNALTAFTYYLIPYVAGRLYFRTGDDLMYLAKGIVWATVLYSPLVLYEVRMSPQIHRMVYGWHQHDFSQVFRFGGFRPMVFLEHGLMLSMWMGMGAITAYWLWFRGRVKRFFGPIPMWLVALGLMSTTVLCRSTGAVILILLGVGLIHAVQLMRSGLVLLVVLAGVIGYMGVRASGAWDGAEAVMMAEYIEKGRAYSLKTRLDAETAVVAHAQQRIVFGWGEFNRFRPFDKDGDLVVVDGMWVLTMSKHGLVGLVSFYALILLPVILVVIRGRGVLHRRENASVLVLAVILLLFAIDCLPNAMVGPPYFILSGALFSACSARVSVRRPRRVGTGGQTTTSAVPEATSMPEAV